ncbi:MAG: RidA family protein [Sandaracinaceae bacterium]|nr:RidA family protein [Sandaracinaceae bacterium]
MPTVIQPSSLATPRGYSNGLLYPSGRVLFVAGQVGWDAKCRLVSPELAEQFAQALDNILAVVREAGGGPEHVGRLTIYVTDKKRYLAVTRAIGVAYRERFGKHYPAMSLVQVADLLEDGALVEIEATAVLP